MPLEAIVYTSSAVSDITDATLEQLLHEARRKNKEVGITGVLLYHDGSFFQYFEGPPGAVDEVYARIRRSRLHRGIIELMRSGIERRSFGDWLMGFTRAPSSTVLKLSNASWKQSLGRDADDPSKVSSDGLALLLQFWSASGGSSDW